MSCGLLLHVSSSFLDGRLSGHSRNDAAGMGILAVGAASDILRSAIVLSQSVSMDFMGISQHFRLKRWERKGRDGVIGSCRETRLRCVVGN